AAGRARVADGDRLDAVCRARLEDACDDVLRRRNVVDLSRGADRVPRVSAAGGGRSLPRNRWSRCVRRRLAAEHVPREIARPSRPDCETRGRVPGDRLALTFGRRDSLNLVLRRTMVREGEPTMPHRSSETSHPAVRSRFERPTILMCPPDHYGIEYEINP